MKELRVEFDLHRPLDRILRLTKALRRCYDGEINERDLVRVTDALAVEAYLDDLQIRHTDGDSA